MSNNKLKIFCFGDSLTNGTKGWMDTPYPYGTVLNNILTENNIDNEVIVSGVDGEKTSSMNFRIVSEFDESYTHLILLGGTNDLGTNVAPDIVIENLKGMYNYILNKNDHIKIIALTVPPILNDRWPDLLENRNKLNSDIIELVSEKDRMEVIDLYSCLMEIKENFPDEFESLYYRDGLHFNNKGYEYIAKLIYKSYDFLSS